MARVAYGRVQEPVSAAYAIEHGKHPVICHLRKLLCLPLIVLITIVVAVGVFFVFFASALSQHAGRPHTRGYIVLP